MRNRNKAQSNKLNQKLKFEEATQEEIESRMQSLA